MVSYISVHVCFSAYTSTTFISWPRGWMSWLIRALWFSLLSVPTKPPTNIKGVSSTLSSIKVSWGSIPKDYRNGIILGYVVFFREGTSGPWSEHDASLAYAKELTGLISGKLYSVRVAAYTKIGQGTRARSTSIIVGGSTIPWRFYPKEKDTSCLHIQYQVSC